MDLFLLPPHFRLVFLFVATFLLLTSTTASPATKESRELLRQGVAELKEQKFEAAREKFEAAAKADPGDAEAIFLHGVTLNRLRLHKEALAKLEEARAKGFDHRDLRFEIGWSLLGLRRWKEAASELERYEEASPGRGETSELLGRAYLALGDYDKAEAKLQEAIQRDPNLKLDALFYLGLVERSREVREGKPWRLSLSFGGGYSSNAIALGEGVSLPPDISRKSSGFSRFSLDGSYRFRLTTRDNLTLGYGFLSDVYNVTSKLNLLDHAVSANYRHAFSQDLAGGILISNEFSQIGKQNFRNQWGLRPVLGYRFSNWGVAEVVYSLVGSNYYFPAIPIQDRDSLSHTIALNNYFTIPGTQLRSRLGYFHVWNPADGADFDFQTNALVLGLSHPLFWQITGEILYIRSFERFGKRNSLAEPGGFAFNRKDDVDAVALQLVHPILHWLKVYARYDFTNSHSNIRFFNYGRHAGNTGFVIDF